MMYHTKSHRYYAVIGKPKLQHHRRALKLHLAITSVGQTRRLKSSVKSPQLDPLRYRVDLLLLKSHSPLLALKTMRLNPLRHQQLTKKQCKTLPEKSVCCAVYSKAKWQA